MRFIIKPSYYTKYTKTERHILMHGSAKFTKKEHRGLFSVNEIVDYKITKLNYKLGVSSDTKVIELSIPITIDDWYDQTQDINNFHLYEEHVSAFEEYKKLETEFGNAFHRYEEARKLLVYEETRDSLFGARKLLLGDKHSKKLKIDCGKAKRAKNIAQINLRKFISSNQIFSEM